MGITFQLFGGPLAGAIDLDLDRRFKVVSRLLDVSPFTVGAAVDADLESYAENEESAAVCLDVRKDLPTRLDEARADYLVLDLASAAMPVVAAGPSWYSIRRAERSRLLDDLRNHERVRPWEPAALQPDLEQNFERFIDAILVRYPADRIILFTSQVARFYWDGAAIRPRTRDPQDLRAFLRRLETRFQDRTGCRVVDCARDFLPRRDGRWIDLELGADFQKAAEQAIVAICTEQSVPAPRPQPDEEMFSDWAWRTAVGKVPPTVEDILSRMTPAGSVGTACSKPVLFAVAALLATFGDLDQTAIAGALVADPANDLVRRTRERFEANRQLLADYDYCFVPGLEDAVFLPSITVPVAGHWWLTVRPGAAAPFRFQPLTRQDGMDPAEFGRRFANAGYCCRLDSIDNALESWWAYFQKARTGDTRPFQLEFSDQGEFIDSLSCVDYADVLHNERFCLRLAGQELPTPLEWKPAVDASFLFDPDTRITCIRDGLGDQLFYYVYPRLIATRANLRLYVDDLYFDLGFHAAKVPHTRPDFLRLIKPDGVFSELFSARLRDARRRSNSDGRESRDEYYRLGLPEMVWVTTWNHVLKVRVRERPTCLMAVIADLEELERAMLNPNGIAFVDVLARMEFVAHQLVAYKQEWESVFGGSGDPGSGDYVRPDSTRIAGLMLATDAIVVHVRRGDRVARGWSDGDDYYREYVRRTAALEEYADKHWFVFSDDLDYCRTHQVELGLDVAGDKITFVEGNHHFADVDDFRLIQLGKVVICGRSGFSAAAAMISRRVEHIFGARYSITPGGDHWSRHPPAASGDE